MGGEEERKRGGRRRKRRAEDSQCDGAGRDRAESRRAIPLGFGVPDRDGPDIHCSETSTRSRTVSV